MQSHIGCIYLTFLQSVFLNVSWNHLPEKMQSYIGCIYLTFLHCAFSNVSSNCLHEKGHSHIVRFPNRLAGTLSKLVALAWLFSMCVFKCLLKSPACVDAKSHWLHLFDFSPMCVFKCLRKLHLDWEDVYQNWLHLFDFSSLCAFKCLLKSPIGFIFTLVTFIEFLFPFFKSTNKEKSSKGDYILALEHYKRLAWTNWYI